MTANVKALFFDVFGTLVDWRTSIARETELLLRPLGVDLNWTLFADAWRARAESWRFDEVNDLIERHNSWYQAESRLPMDPRRGDFVLVNGRDYRLEPLDAAWILARYAAVLADGAAAA